MSTFSERYGYVKPSDVIIRESMPTEVVNAICNCFGDYAKWFSPFVNIDKYVWKHFLNKLESEYPPYSGFIIMSFLQSYTEEWYNKIDLLEFTIKYLIIIYNSNDHVDSLIKTLNVEFERLHYGYRIVKGEIVEIASATEVNSIEEALKVNLCGVQTHLAKALELYALRPKADCSNSIKESISAVEAICRDLTGKGSLGESLNEMKKNGLFLQPQMREGLEKLYAYTNQPNTGIRHPLMETTSKYIPGQGEALFMLVCCSAFVNYLNDSASGMKGRDRKC